MLNGFLFSGVKRVNINWKVRLRHRQFWLSMVSLLIILGKQIASLFGYDIGAISEEIQQIIETILMILVILGVIVDPTTSGISDSKEALDYKEPKKS